MHHNEMHKTNDINIKEVVEFKMYLSNDFNNHWLAGFSDGDAIFRIKILYIVDKSKPEIFLNYEINHKNSDILILIKEFFGGDISYRKGEDTYYYGSVTFGSANKVIKYFDNFHLQSSKYINYLKWRKTYRLIQNKYHLMDQGIKDIMKLKNSMIQFKIKS